MKNKGQLFLIPADLGNDKIDHIWPPTNLQTIGHIRHFIIENERSARRFLRKAGFSAPFEEVHLYSIGKHSDQHDVQHYLNAAQKGLDMGLLSEAGVPCVADPGQYIVQLAHQQGIRVIPLVGASSVFLALMASGFNGQHFSFHGYLPIEKTERMQKITAMEKRAWHNDETQICMETPFRNKMLFEDILSSCAPDTMLSISLDLTLPSEYIRSMSVSAWKKQKPDLHKRPGIFLLYKGR